MKKWYRGVIATSSLMLLFLGLYMIRNPINGSSFNPLNLNRTDPLGRVNMSAPPARSNPNNSPQVISAEVVVADFFTKRNLSKKEERALQTWNHMHYLVANPQGLPNAAEAIKEAGIAWKSLITSVEEEKMKSNGSLPKKGNKKQCPHFISKMNTSKHDGNGFKFPVPCGLTQGSSITFIGIPNGLLGDFRVDLTGEPLPGEPDPSIILHYNVRLHGDKTTEDPIIVQNTWTVAHDWGEEERCPSPNPEKIKKVDEMEQCNELVGRENNQTIRSSKNSTAYDSRKYFPFKQNDLFVSTLRVGVEGIQMTVDGKHVTSFAFREALEPWLVSEVTISGDINLLSVVASGLPTSEDSNHVIDLESLKAVPLPPRGELNFFIGVFSTANNFKRRMSVRRSWMQYPEVRSGQVAVRFFVGLHKNQMVNEELWNEATTYEDIQLMPFVDYYSLITWKTIAICMFGSEIVPANFIMKTDDDSFVRIDEILNTLRSSNATRGLLYGSVSSDSQPDRDPDGKWYISTKEWPDDKYPPWAHGPGYVVSKDIATTVSREHRAGRLKLYIITGIQA
ncbi:beta-1,3-galactosyltransferase GALT1-like isoform X2 [Andrographis paniculata]|uniref:beta-1,3-galactosyltransferase GALT1-like isoform X2 n=1 Tax=Andrographis paniculata TaxID=175694 RepID=UPI0021E7B47D|nr:beta-1,3-galactosyltransferase GALT1-like isoform X2 [Andrographis paniculata]